MANTEEGNRYQYIFKTVLVGNSSVGKSSLVIRETDNEFSDVFITTIGVDFRFKAFQIGDSTVKLQMWDTAGQEKFRTIASSYYKGANAIIIVFDLSDLRSFNDATNYWFNELQNVCPP